MSDVVPAEWRTTTLGRVTVERKERVGTRVHDPIVLSSTKHFGLVPSEDYFRNRIVHSHDLAFYKRVDRHWFAYATNHLPEGSIGLQEEYDDACVSPIYTVFSARPDIDPRYLYRVLRSPTSIARYRISERASVDRRGAVRYSDFGKISIRLPPIDEQRRIVEILDSADEAIRSTERVVAKLRRIRTAVLHHVSRARPSELGLRTLAEVLEGRPKNGYSPVEVEEWTGTVMLGLACLTQDGFAPAQLKNAPAGDAKLRSALLTDGDVLMSRANTSDLVGMVGTYRDIGGPCSYPDLMMRLRPGPAVSAEYLEIALRTPDARRQIQAVASGTSASMAKISSSTVLGLTISVPSRREQEGIVRLYRAMREQIEARDAELAKLREVKKGLLDDLLAGRVRVGAAEDTISA
jgi:hypothetical protein